MRRQRKFPCPYGEGRDGDCLQDRLMTEDEDPLLYEGVFSNKWSSAFNPLNWWIAVEGNECFYGYTLQDHWLNICPYHTWFADADERSHH